MIVLPPLLMHMLDEDNSVKPRVGRNLAFSFLNSVSYSFNEKNSTIRDNTICKDHDHEVLKPHLTSTWMPNSIGSMSGKSVVFAESEVKLDLPSN
jgi:teneurin